MTKTAFHSLPSAWQDWIAGNLARACEPAGMAEILVRDGRFDPSLARSAIEEASDGSVKLCQPALAALPDIDTSSNSIHTSDRVVDVLFTLASPRIVLLGNVLSEEEASALTAYCQSRLERSPVVNDDDGTIQQHRSRTSRGAFIQ